MSFRTILVAFATLSLVAAAACVVSDARASVTKEIADQHVDAIMAMLGGKGDDTISEFIRSSMAPDENAFDERLRSLSALRDSVHGLRDEVGLDFVDGGLQIILAGEGRQRKLLVSFDNDKIADISPVEASADNAPANRDEAVRDHVRAIETSFRASLDDVITDFESKRLSPEFLIDYAPGERRSLFDAIQQASRNAGGVLVGEDEDDGQVRITLEGDDGVAVVSIHVDDTAPFRISQIQLDEGGRSGRNLGMTLGNIESVMTNLLEEEGFASVVYLAVDGKEVHRGAYGLVDPEADEPVAIDTIFGIGSRPIDFTMAALLLLVQRGEISLDDPISKYFDDVQSDKANLTLRHLLTGQSGLPDFHGLPSDWDQDLAWIDRTEAEHRILAQALLFPPGQGESHSHSAFGLLAAVIERVAGKDYMAFLAENFFEPAGMTRTGEYGSLDGHDVSEFAVGRGPSFVGDPNIPPNWGKTSWLVKGSGGMYSTLNDLLKFYSFVRTSGVLEDRYRGWFLGSSINIDGSERGFELFSAYDEDGADTAFLFMAVETPSEAFRDVARALESLVDEN